MIPVQPAGIKNQGGEHHKNNQCNDFLDYFQLHQWKGTPIANKSDSVCRDLEGVFCKSNHPRKKDNPKQRPVTDKAHLLKL